MIIFSRELNESRLRMAYNNDVIRFYSNIAADALYCDITASNPITSIAALNMRLFSARLYPDPQGKFYFNFKPYITALINTKNFEDTLQTTLQSPEPSSFIYNYTSGTTLGATVTIKITHENNTISQTSGALQWLAGVEQLGDYNNLLKSGMYMLSPFVKDTANHYYLKYWQGYPFDFGVYLGQGTRIVLKNETTALSQQFAVRTLVNRIFLSDGRTDESLEDLLPMDEGYNRIRLMKSSISSSEDKFITLEKVPYRCGVYLKWLNKYGGYSYWLFEDTYSVDRSTKQLGELDRDFANLDDTFGRTTQIGKESQDTIKVTAELLTEEERTIVEGILDSPKIYLFTGKPLSQNSYRNWVEVTLKTGSARLRNPKQPLTNFTFDIELPVRYTQTL